MLRRPPTTIRLTTEDVIAFDEKKSKENEQKTGVSSQPIKKDRSAMTKEERLGIKPQN